MSQSGIGPFPLQRNLRRLKPSLGRLMPVLAGLGYVLVDEDIREGLFHWLQTPEGMVVGGMLLAVTAFLLADLFLKKVHYNESGVGVERPFGGENTWYSFDELKAGQFQLKRRSKRLPGRQLRPSNRLTLQFHTGTVRLWPELYDSKGIGELTGILSRRFPDQYRPIQLKPTGKEKKEQEKLEKSRQAGERLNKRNQRKRDRQERLERWKESRRKRKNTPPGMG